MKRYLVFQVGCIECGEPSGVVSAHDDRDAAQVHADDLPEFVGGQRAYYVIDTQDSTFIDPMVDFTGRIGGTR